LPDVGLDLEPVAVQRALLDADDLDPPIDQHAERRLEPRLPALVDLAEQLDPHAVWLGPRLGGLPCRVCRRWVSGSTPTYTRTRKLALGS
jgi:hypothetical protein